MQNCTCYLKFNTKDTLHMSTKASKYFASDSQEITVPQSFLRLSVRHAADPGFTLTTRAFSESVNHI